MKKHKENYEEKLNKTASRVLGFLHLQTRRISLVLIKWLLNGERVEETVPLASARHRRMELESKGAIIYWSERLLTSS